jgi:hypothetical protein
MGVTFPPFDKGLQQSREINQANENQTINPHDPEGEKGDFKQFRFFDLPPFDHDLETCPCDNPPENRAKKVVKRFKDFPDRDRKPREHEDNGDLTAVQHGINKSAPDNHDVHDFGQFVGSGNNMAKEAKDDVGHGEPHHPKEKDTRNGRSL